MDNIILNKEDLDKLLEQIKKYKLDSFFKSENEFIEWVESLSVKQIKNFNNIDVEPCGEIACAFLDSYLLNCEDYNEKINTILKLKNVFGIKDYVNHLVSPAFLASEKFTDEINKLSESYKVIQCGIYSILRIIDNVDFINSPYHDEDFNLILNLMDENNKYDGYRADVLADVASNKDSINSKYHREDMKVLASCNFRCLKHRSCSMPQVGLNDLATNPDSLNDLYHLSNMRLLSLNPITFDCLAKIMINPEVINGKYYREEVTALLNAGSKIKAIAMYYYIVNPKRKYLNHDVSLMKEFKEVGIFRSMDISLLSQDQCLCSLEVENTEAGRKNPNYLSYLKLLNEIDDHIVMFISTLLSMPSFSYSKYVNKEIEELKNIKRFIKDKYVYNFGLFMNLYMRLLTNEVFLQSPYHSDDFDRIIRKSVSCYEGFHNYSVRWLVKAATNKDNVLSGNHSYDMEYITKLDFSKLTLEIMKQMEYYLFDKDGIGAINHIEALEKLFSGELVDIVRPEFRLSSYCNELFGEEPRVIGEEGFSRIKSKFGIK